MTSVKYNGNSQWAYGYDYEDRLVSAQKVGGGTDSYSYTGEGGRYYITDSLGGRLQCNDGEDPTSPLLYDGLNFFDGGIGQTVGSSGTDVSYVTDSLGSTLGDIDSTHTVKENDVYDAFGNIVYAGSLFSYPNGESVLYGGAQGYHTDNDTGLIRCGNRYYNPYIGRFITEDAESDRNNWYAYCRNDTVNCGDPDGLTYADSAIARGNANGDKNRRRPFSRLLKLVAGTLASLSLHLRILIIRQETESYALKPSIRSGDIACNRI